MKYFRLKDHVTNEMLLNCKFEWWEEAHTFIREFECELNGEDFFDCLYIKRRKLFLYSNSEDDSEIIKLDIADLIKLDYVEEVELDE